MPIARIFRITASGWDARRVARGCAEREQAPRPWRRVMMRGGFSTRARTMETGPRAPDARCARGWTTDARIPARAAVDTANDMLWMDGRGKTSAALGVLTSRVEGRRRGVRAGVRASVRGAVRPPRS